MICYDLPSLFFKKKWCWFAKPHDLFGADMATFFSYDDVAVSGFKKKEGLTSVIDLVASLGLIESRFRQKFIREQIRKGERNGIAVAADQNFAGFKRIYFEFRKQKNLPRDSFRALRDHGVLFSAYANKKMIAGGVFIGDGEYLRAWVLASARTGSGSGRDRELVGQANRIIISEAIKWAKAGGYKIFDLGGINPFGSDEDQRLAEFKEAFGGERRACFYYSKVYSLPLRFWLKLRK